jgi:small subunit ribosomal protein S4
MARYTGPKARVNRRIGTLIYESAGASRALERRDNPPGMHQRGRRASTYGAALTEKQKIKHYYGILERQLRRFFDRAQRMKGNTGENLLVLCERRLDNVVRRAGFTKTRPQARQGVVHGHFTVNGRKTVSPSYIVRPGDVIQVKARDNIKTVYQAVLAENRPETVDWLGVDVENLTITVQGHPSRADISLPVDANVVVEFMSR